jgi:phosphoribosylformylglycinamidine synthase subunit PurL
VTPVVTTEPLRRLAAELGLTDAEYDEIVAGLGRAPNRTELAALAGMWSEHCSYKSTRRLLATLPTDGPRVLAGPGAHAGCVDVGDGWAVAFKIESHNHPSAVEPYQGAATGIGGILRDVVAQGARPVAVMDALCFGDPTSPRTQWLEDGVVAGIGGYGNAYGVPNVGGCTVYHPGYEANPLVNALAAGLVRHDEMRTAAASGEGNAVVYVGATTGRDGILGAAFASEELLDEGERHASRSHVQVGDPFMGRKLMEALLTFGADDGLIADQDLGACGIACAAAEMAAAGGVGIDVDLDAVPLREPGMDPGEVLLSESQERFLLVVAADRVAAALDHFRTRGVHAAVIGRVTGTGRLQAVHDGATVVDLPAPMVADGAPDQPWEQAPSLPTPEPYPRFDPPSDPGRVLLRLLAEPGISDPSHIYRRYDQTVGNRTMRGPGQGEAAVLRLPGTEAAMALTLVGRGGGCAVDPYLGVQALLGEAMRNLACVGAEAVAITDGINVGSPRDPVEYRRLAELIGGLGDGLRLLGLPVTGGNCSLYNESPTGAIPPTPMIGMLGLVARRDRVPGPAAPAGSVLFLIGRPGTTPVFSAYGRVMTGSAQGDPPAADLDVDRRLAAFLVAECAAGRVAAAKDAAMGGISVSLAKLALRSDTGAVVSIEADERADWALFGEYPGCTWVAVTPEYADAFAAAAAAAGVPCRRAGSVGGTRLIIEGMIDLALEDLRGAYTDRRWQTADGRRPTADSPQEVAR